MKGHRPLIELYLTNQNYQRWTMTKYNIALDKEILHYLFSSKRTLHPLCKLLFLTLTPNINKIPTNSQFIFLELLVTYRIFCKSEMIINNEI